MKYLEQIRLVQFFLYEAQDVRLGEITGIFGPNGTGKSALLDAVQIALMGANERLVALNAQADEKKTTTRSLRAYCLGQYGADSEHRVRDNATTYITLIWRDTETGTPLSMGVCLYASADRDNHEVLGRYVMPEVELSMGDHLEVVDGAERPRSWATFRHQIIERSKVSGENPLYENSQRYITAALLALRGAGSVPAPEAFTRAFRFALRMRFDKTVDQIVRDDVLEDKPTNIKKFKEVTESFRRLAEMVAQVETKLADGERVSAEYTKAADESRRVATWGALSKMASSEVANDLAEQAVQAKVEAEEALQSKMDEKQNIEGQITEAKDKAQENRLQREAHAAHKDYGAVQTSIQTATLRAQEKRTEISNNLGLIQRTLASAAGSNFLKHQSSELIAAASAVEPLCGQMKSLTKDGVLSALRPALRAAQSAFNDLFRQGGKISRDLEKAQEAVSQAESNLERVKTGRPPLTKDVQRLMTELGDHGIQATPVCDVVRITDPEWQPVIEAYLSKNVEALLVRTDQENDAFRIYRGLTGSQAVYGAKIAMESRQAIGKIVGQDTVAALIEGDHPAAVAYLRRQFGDVLCASTDNEALAGRRTLTRDGMLVSSGEIDRLRPVQPSQFRIGAGSFDHRGAVLGELQDCRNEVQRLEREEGELKQLLEALRQVGHQDSIERFIATTLDEIDGAEQEINSKTKLLEDAADEDYVRLGEEEKRWNERARGFEGEHSKILIAIGSAQTTLDQRNLCETQTKAAYELALAASTEARQHPDVDPDFESRQWDVLLEKHDTDYSEMVRYATEKQTGCNASMGKAINAGSRELGIFLQKYREQAPKEVTTDWLMAHTWLSGLLERLRDTELADFRAQMDDAYRTSQETFRNDVAIALNTNLNWLEATLNRLNTVLRECPTFSNGERYRFRRVVRPQLDSLLKFVKSVEEHGPADDLFGGPGELPDEFRALLDDKTAPGATGVRSPLDDYREFFEFDIEILREDPLTKVSKVVDHLSKRLGPGSGGEHRAPLYVIAGAALASAYRLDHGRKDGLRLMLLDEAFNKMDATNIIATMRYIEDLGLQVFMASPGENLGILTAFLHRYYDILRDVDNNSVMIEGRDVRAETRALFREDLPEFNPTLVEQELASMRSHGSQQTPNAVV